MMDADDLVPDQFRGPIDQRIDTSDPNLLVQSNPTPICARPRFFRIRQAIDGRVHDVGPYDLDITKPRGVDREKPLVRLTTKDGTVIERNFTPRS